MGLKAFYRRHLQKGFFLVSRAPDLLNLAFSDFSVQYFAAAFSSEDHVVLRGRVPNLSEGVRYFSMVAYDTMGQPIFYVCDEDLMPNYSLILSDMNHRGPYALVVRFYMNNEIQDLRTDLLPRVMCNGIELDMIGTAAMIQHTNRVRGILGFLLRNRSFCYPPPGLETRSFFIPSRRHHAALFPNPDAEYMVSFPLGSRVLCITGLGPTNMRFAGFMACNLGTTATDSCIELSFSPYEVWVAFCRKEAYKRGYTDSSPLLLWKNDNQYPFILYRTVAAGRDFSCDMESLAADACALREGAYYPRIRAMD